MVKLNLYHVLFRSGLDVRISKKKFIMFTLNMVNDYIWESGPISHWDIHSLYGVINEWSYQFIS